MYFLRFSIVKLDKQVVIHLISPLVVKSSDGSSTSVS